MNNSSYVENCFFIKNKKKFFSYEKVITVKEAIELCKDKKLSIYNFDFCGDENFDEEKFLNLKINSYDCFKLGLEGESSRGFEFFYDNKNKNYIVRILTPSTKEDWLLALEYSKVLAEKMKADIIYEKKEIYTVDTIKKFDYKNDTIRTLKEFKNILSDPNDQPRTIMLNGIHRTIIFNEKICDDILNEIDPVQAFDSFLKPLQYIEEAINLEQNITILTNEKTGKDTLLGIYILGTGMKVILPYSKIPVLEDESLLTNEILEKIEWGIFLDFVSDKSKKDLSMLIKYADFITNLPEDKYKKLDGAYMLLDELTVDEMFDIYKKSERVNL